MCTAVNQAGYKHPFSTECIFIYFCPRPRDNVMAEIARTTIPSSNGFCHNRQCALPRVKRNRLFMAASHSVYSPYVNTRKARRSPTVCHDVRVGPKADILHCNLYVRFTPESGHQSRALVLTPVRNFTRLCRILL